MTGNENADSDSLRFYCDENIDYEVCLALNRAGFDTVHVKDRGRRGASDPDQFQTAIQEERIVLTHDRTDFVEKNRDYIENGAYYPGIVIAKFGTVGDVLHGIHLLIEKYDFLENSVWYI
jgi:predicted nuclease of predicted toxin-antitoxin system